ncbi:DoxX family protein [Zwartia panacis]|jgi:putative oxidoreductase|uniref:DoxX family protein n=1 Tax=Zwartia panacis TaxID=2683345 RepID=UPI0025B3B497|nr:DoxX family protein [Zwartia panacis]MDN4016784.1 DoxX family protein [Zwartia panacis]
MNRYDDIGKLVLRLSVGILLLMHGLHKLMNGIGGISAMVQANGWPFWVAYGVYIGEIIAPVLLIVGLLTRISAVVVVLNMLVAVYLAHSHQLFHLTKTGGWLLELQGLYLFGALAIALLGAGRFSVGGAQGRLN